MRNKIQLHDVLAPWPLADAAVDAIVTSPPYWGLRDYGVEGQLGMEDSPEEYVANVVRWTREAWRVLKPWGTFWLVIGDTYWGGKGQSGGSRADLAHSPHTLNAAGVNFLEKGETRPQDRRHALIKNKEQVGIPWMVAFALRAEGWWVRQENIWHKPNPLPESMDDRCTRSHETIFLLTKAADYYYDQDAIMEKAAYDGRKATMMAGAKKYEGQLVVPDTKEQSFFSGAHERWRTNEHGEFVRNKRDVWTVPTKGYEGTHFATYPEALILPCVLAATSEKGNCARCGRPWERVTEKVVDVGHTGASETAYGQDKTAGRLALLRQAAREQGFEYSSERKTVGWQPTCECKEEALIRPVVCDPFMGAGTTALVCLSNNRDFTGLDLDPKNLIMAHKRLLDEHGIFYLSKLGAT